LQEQHDFMEIWSSRAIAVKIPRLPPWTCAAIVNLFSAFIQGKRAGFVWHALGEDSGALMLTVIAYFCVLTLWVSPSATAPCQTCPVMAKQAKTLSLSLSCHVPCFKLLAEGEGRAVSSEPMKLFDSLFLSSFSNFIYSLNLSCLPFSLIENLMIWSSPLF
jgi:hypothetical protein